jgi:membrane-associated phospholipid phosphatase
VPGSWWEPLNRREARLIADTPVLPARVPHPVVTAVTTAGRGGGLWLAICAIEALRPGGNRRLARRGAASVAGALAVSHVLKLVLPHRPRPEPPGGKARRSLPETPDSSSFPSAHAATAAAITATLLRHKPKLAALAAPLTLTATYGRLRTRVHWPSDLVAGTAIGLAAAAVLDRPRVWERCQ